MDNQWYFAEGKSDGWYVFNSDRSRVYFKSSDGCIGPAFFKDFIWKPGTLRLATKDEIKEFTGQ